MNFELLLNQVIWGILVGVSYSLLAIGFSVIYSTSDAVNFAQGEYAMLGAYFCFTFMNSFNFMFLLAAAASLVCIFVFGRVIERIVFRRLYKLDPLFIVICTIGLSTMLKNLVLIFWGPESQTLPFEIEIEPFTLLGATMHPKNLILLAIGILVMVVFHVFMTRTKMGMSMRAVAQNKGVASLMGINVTKSINLTWGLGALIAGVGGILIGLAYDISIEMGGLVSMKGFAAAIIGRFGNVIGAMFGGVILGVVESIGGFVVSSYYKDVITFAIIILILLVKPSGLLIRKNTIRRV